MKLLNDAIDEGMLPITAAGNDKGRIVANANGDYARPVNFKLTWTYH